MIKINDREVCLFWVLLKGRYGLDELRLHKSAFPTESNVDVISFMLHLAGMTVYKDVC